MLNQKQDNVGCLFSPSALDGGRLSDAAYGFRGPGTTRHAWESNPYAGTCDNRSMCIPPAIWAVLLVVTLLPSQRSSVLTGYFEDRWASCDVSITTLFYGAS